MDISTDKEQHILSIDSSEVVLPAKPQSTEVFADFVVVLFSHNSSNPDKSGVKLPSMSRNLMAFDENGTHRWTVEPYTDSGDSRHYIRLYEFNERCICKRWANKDDENWVEIDPRTGAIQESFPIDSLRVGGRIRRFDREIQYFFTFNDYSFVIEDSDHGTYGNYVTAFDSTENEVWHRQFVSGWLMEEDGRLLSMHEPRMGANTDVEHNPATGEPISIYRSVFDTREELETYLPKSMHHLIDEYIR